jgi:ADP-ribose pyrophosphatase YjhB (NUDIX family)
VRRDCPNFGSVLCQSKGVELPDTSTEETYEIIESVIGFVLIEGLILCFKRSDNDKAFPGKWGFPGGKVNKGEQPASVLFEEVRRKTGLSKTDSVSFVGKYKAIHDARKKIYKISAFQLEYQFPVNLKLSSEYSELKLCTPEEIVELELAGKVPEGLLKQYMKRVGLLEEDDYEDNGEE